MYVTNTRPLLLANTAPYTAPYTLPTYTHSRSRPTTRSPSISTFTNTISLIRSILADTNRQVSLLYHLASPS